MYNAIKSVLDFVNSGQIDSKIAKNIIEEILAERKKESTSDVEKDEIAVIGIAGKFASFKDVNEFWDTLITDGNGVRALPKNRIQDMENLKKILFSTSYNEEILSGYLDEIDSFDYKHFNLSPKEAKLMDPNQRIFLEVAYKALEDSGYHMDYFRGSKTGVFVGSGSWPLYGHYLSLVSPEEVQYAIPGNVTSITASRLSYLLNLKGPSMVIDTACSSSLTAVHLACKSILQGECNMAIAGGIRLDLGNSDATSGIGIESKSYCTRSFDNEADGTVWGEGAGAILLKPLKQALKDNDNIYAVIKGSAINQDGASVGITAPNAKSQEEVLLSAWEDAKINPETIHYIEAHGTATSLGDVVEVQAITNAFKHHTLKKQFCGIGSVKSNVGHLDTAAGIVGMIKMILALKRKKLPATINFNKPNQQIDFSNSPVYVHSKLTDWNQKDGLRRCGVSSFGLSGTNCHIVLEEAPDRTTNVETQLDKHLIFALAAADEEELDKLILKYLEYFDTGYFHDVGLDDLCKTVCVGKNHPPFRIAIITDSMNYLQKCLINYLASKNKGENQKKVFWDNKKGSCSQSKTLREKDEFWKDFDRIIQLANEYVLGNTVQWELYYKSIHSKKVSTPGTILNSSRCWLDIPESYLGLGLNIISKKEENEYQSLFTLNGRESNVYTSTEVNIGSIWGEVLGYQSIDICSSFYELGGDSIIGLQICKKISDLYNMELSLKSFMENNTIEKLSMYVEELDMNRCETNKLFQQYCIEDTENANRAFPLTDVQMAYFLGRSSNQENKDVSTHVYFEMGLKVKVENLQNVINTLIARHPMLRTIIMEDATQKTLEVIPYYNIPLSNIISLSKKEQDNLIFVKREELSHQNFAIGSWPMFEIKAFQLETDYLHLMINLDMLIADGHSINILKQEIFQLLQEPNKELPKLTRTFQDYIMAYKRFEKSELYLKSKEFWLKKIEEMPLSPQFPGVAEGVSKGRFKRKSYTFIKEEWSEIKRKIQKLDVTYSSYLCAVYGQILSYWCNQPSILMNLTIFNRIPFFEDINGIVGDFTSILLLGINLQDKVDFKEYVKYVQEELFLSIDNRYYDGVNVMREITRVSSNKLVAPVVFTSLMFPEERESSEIYWKKSSYDLSETSQVYLDCQIAEENGSLIINWDYLDGIFDDEIISKMFDTYISMVNKNMTGEVYLDLSVKDKVLLEKYNDTYEEIRSTLLHQMFKDKALELPNATAIKLGDKKISYQKLDEDSSKVAHYILNQGIAKNKVIGVLAERSINTIINILGILKAGAAYVPISTEFPEERRRYIIEHSGCQCMLTPEDVEMILDLNYTEESLLPEVDADDIAYIIYTSGSTGKPKGVVITHDAACNTIIDINNRFNVNSEDKIIGISSMCFDLSVYDIFGALAVGATLVMIENPRDISNLITVVNEEQITVWNSVPTIMKMLLEFSQELKCFDNLRLIMLSGDWIGLDIPPKVFKQCPNSKLISLGGATEASIWSIYYPITVVNDEWKSIPYGYPLKNQTIYVLDYMGRVCPIGTLGEIYIGGRGIAKGYCNDEEKTKDAFIDHTVFGRLYRTGDYGVMHENAEGLYTEFLGRKDNQVKIQGYRIELGEIEKALHGLHQVQDAVVADKIDSSGKKYLCAYLILSEHIESEKISEYLRERLPSYMIPVKYMEIKEVPMNSNGKVDRSKLPEPASSNLTEKQFLEAGNEIERQLSEIWKGVLNLEQISIDDSFFELGADSLLITKGYRMIEALYPKKIKITDLFAYPTILKLSEIIGSSDKEIYKTLPIKQLPLPSYFFTDNQDIAMIKEKLFSLDKNSIERFLASHHLGAEHINDLIFMVYVFLLANVSGMNNIPVHYSKEAGNYYAIGIELENVVNCQTFMENLQKTSEDTNTYRYNLEQELYRIDEKENQIVPFYSYNYIDSENFEQKRIFNLALSMKETTSDEIICSYIYDISKLNKEVIEDMFSKFMEVIELIFS